MKKVKYDGVRPRGTIQPRRIWWPGEVLEVEDDVADELVKTLGFTLVEQPKSRRKREKR
jgi:hypothetical protein